MNAAVGDKVLIKAQGLRGIVSGVNRERIVIVDIQGKPHSLVANQIVNYSLAARKAWEKMPQRQVGRPVGTKRTDRVSVTLRIDRDLWDEFRAAEEKGLIADRTTTVNDWIRQKLRETSSDIDTGGV